MQGVHMIRNLLKSLLKPSAYPEETSRVEMLQTHVFLAIPYRPLCLQGQKTG
jgi:hypothetical protein